MKRIRTHSECMLLLEAYNEYVQIKAEEMRGTGWCPVSVEEFAESEYYEIWLRGRGQMMSLEDAIEIVMGCAKAGMLSDDEINDETQLRLIRQSEAQAIATVEDFFVNHVFEGRIVGYDGTNDDSIEAQDLWHDEDLEVPEDLTVQEYVENMIRGYWMINNRLLKGRQSKKKEAQKIATVEKIELLEKVLQRIKASR